MLYALREARRPSYLLDVIIGWLDGRLGTPRRAPNQSLEVTKSSQERAKLAPRVPKLAQERQSGPQERSSWPREESARQQTSSPASTLSKSTGRGGNHFTSGGNLSARAQPNWGHAQLAIHLSKDGIRSSRSTHLRIYLKKLSKYVMYFKIKDPNIPRLIGK